MAKGIWASRKPKSNNERRGQGIIQAAHMKDLPVSASVLETLDCHREASMIGASPSLPRVDTTDTEEAN